MLISIFGLFVVYRLIVHFVPPPLKAALATTHHAPLFLQPRQAGKADPGLLTLAKTPHTSAPVLAWLERSRRGGGMFLESGLDAAVGGGAGHSYQVASLFSD